MTLADHSPSLGSEDVIAQEFSGTEADETLLGTTGNDIFVASGGNDRIWGGNGGVDTLVLSGTASQYRLLDNGNGSFTLTDMRKGSPDGSIVVRAIDVLEFTDGARDFGAYSLEQASVQFGTAGDDILLGTAGDDTFIAGGGVDKVWGGTGGNDTLVLSGQLSDYDIVQNDNVLRQEQWHAEGQQISIRWPEPAISNQRRPSGFRRQGRSSQP